MINPERRSEIVAAMRNTGHCLITNPQYWCGGSDVLQSPYRGLLALGAALLEGACLYSALNDPYPLDSEKIRPMFDGGESNGPNIDSRLRIIRDLCSASTFALNALSCNDGSNPKEEFIDDSFKESEHEQRIWLGPFVAVSALNNEGERTELCRLLGDVFESFVHVSHILQILQDNADKRLWNEAYREVCHIRDHFDYAEEILMASIFASSD